MSRRQSFSSTLSFGANVPPPIKEEGEHPKDRRSSGSTDYHEDYLHSETLPVPFVGEAEQEEEEEDDSRDIPPVKSKRSTSFTSNRPRSTSSPEEYQYSTSPMATRTRKLAGGLPQLRPQLRRSPSSRSSISSVSPIQSRPSLRLSIEENNTFHTAPSVTPARQSESRASSPHELQLKVVALLFDLSLDTHLLDFQNLPTVPENFVEGVGAARSVSCTVELPKMREQSRLDWRLRRMKTTRSQRCRRVKR